MMDKNEKDLRDTLSLKGVEDGHLNLSIKAGAGAGKTTLLSFRICEQIIKGEPLDKFVIITYTNAAASELRDKISSQLSNLIEEGSLAEKEKEYAQEALHKMELIQISTIHSFLLKILRENAIEANISLDCQKLEENDILERKTRFFDKWFQSHEAQKEIASVLPSGWHHITDDQKDYVVTDSVLKGLFLAMSDIHETIVLDLDPKYSDSEKAVQSFIRDRLPDLIVLRDAMAREWPKDARGVNKSINNDPQEVYDKISAVAASPCPALSEAQLLSEAIKTISKIQKEIATGKKKSFFIRSEPDAGVRSAIPRWSVSQAELDIDSILETIKAVNAARLANKLKDTFQKESLAETRFVSNNDILYRSRKLLENGEILDKYRNRYSKIYVDEFQDTTAIQAEIVTMLSELPGTKHEDKKLEKDKLVVVGDPKQSIYRFTGAEIAVYNRIDSMMESLPSNEGRSVSLNFNYRSNTDIVDWVNTVYATLMGINYSPMQTDWTISDTQVPHGVFRYGIPDLKKDTEPFEVASLILRLVGHDYCLAETRARDHQTGELGAPIHRPIKYSDIMVLTKNTKDMPLYIKAFAQMGIPVDVQADYIITNDDVLRNFINLTEYFSDPKNKKSQYSAIESCYGIDITNASDKANEDLKKKLDKTYNLFRKSKMSPAAIVQHLLTHEEWYVPKGKEIPIYRVREFRIRIHQMIEACLSKNTGDLRELIRLMNVYLENKVSREIPLERKQDAVRLMNVHKAKGLTAQIVIIANRRNPEKCWHSSFKKDGKYYPTLSYSVGQYKAVLPTFALEKDVMTTSKQEEMAESIRLQYVAATRAAQALIIMPNLLNPRFGSTWFSNSAYDYDFLPDILEDWLSIHEPPKSNVDPSVGAIQSAPKEDSNPSTTTPDLDTLYQNKKSANNGLTEPLMISITPSELEDESIKTGCKQPTENEPGDPDYEAESRPYGNIFGLVMHRVYELMVGQYAQISAMANDKRERCIERLINLAILENADQLGDNKEEKAESFRSYLKPIMLRYFDEVLKPIIDDADKVYTEYCFSFFVDEDKKAEFMQIFAPYFKIKEGKTCSQAAEPDASQVSAIDDTVDPNEDDDEADSDTDAEETDDNDSDGTKKGEKTEETREEKNAKAIIMNSGSFAGKIWVNGQADLVVVRKDGTINVYDYKSNKRNGRPLPDFRDRLDKKYEGQLKLYCYAIAKAFSDDTTIIQRKDVHAKLIDLYK